MTSKTSLKSRLILLLVVSQPVPRVGPESADPSTLLREERPASRDVRLDRVTATRFATHGRREPAARAAHRVRLAASVFSGPGSRGGWVPGRASGRRHASPRHVGSVLA